jgi:CRISPR-associated protein Csx16
MRISVERVIDHFEPAVIQPGDIVIGSPPVNLAAQVCTRGRCSLHLSLELPTTLRGQELSAELMRACGAWVEEYCVVHHHSPRVDEPSAH